MGLQRFLGRFCLSRVLRHWQALEISMCNILDFSNMMHWVFSRCIIICSILNFFPVCSITSYLVFSIMLIYKTKLFSIRTIRQRTDQKYSTMLNLIVESRKNFQKKEIYLKLSRRFWRCMQAYKVGQSYAEVMKMFFSSQCQGTVKTHTRISNSNLDV